MILTNIDSTYITSYIVHETMVNFALCSSYVLLASSSVIGFAPSSFSSKNLVHRTGPLSALTGKQDKEMWNSFFTLCIIACPAIGSKTTYSFDLKEYMIMYDMGMHSYNLAGSLICMLKKSIRV